MSPALSWTGVPDGTVELVLIVQDPDAPMLQPFVHWILHGIPSAFSELPEGVPPTATVPPLGGLRQGQNGTKMPGWTGPNPPLGHGVHHYHFQLFALDTALNLPADTSLDALVEKMRGHVLAEGELVGTYEKK